MTKNTFGILWLIFAVVCAIEFILLELKMVGAKVILHLTLSHGFFG